MLPVRVLGSATIAAAFLLLPLVGWFDTTVVVRMALIFLFAIIMLSLGILTGWTGQLSLGQMAFAGIGGAVGAWITLSWGWDIVLATVVAGLVGSAVSLVIGLPALRLQGAYLAVTTLAFELTVVQFFLNESFFDWIPTERVPRQPIFGVIDWSSSRALYYVCLVALILCIVAVRGIRESRVGRVLVALRDNEAATESYGISPTRAKLMAFAIAGFFAAVAGSLITHHQQDFATYFPGFSILVFTGAVVGGLGSIMGAILGSLYWNGTFFWTQGSWRLFASGIGVLLVLVAAPSGIAGLWSDLRDLVLRRWGRRHGVVEEDLAEDLLDNGTDVRGSTEAAP